MPSHITEPPPLTRQAFRAIVDDVTEAVTNGRMSWRTGLEYIALRVLPNLPDEEPTQQGEPTVT